MMAPVSEIENGVIQRILRYVSDDKKHGHIPQPMLIVGSSGTGKTTLLQSLVSALEDGDFTNSLLVLDGKRFFCSQDIIRAIEGADFKGNLPDGNNTETERRIVIIDDLDYFFRRSSFDDQYLLRNYLNKEASPLLIATISAIDASLADYKAPFFEGVRLIYIPSLPASVIEKLNLPLEKKQRIATLMAYLPPVVRSLKTAAEIVEMSDSHETDLKELVGKVAPMYRTKLENLPVYSQKILFSLANSDTPLTLSEFRELTNLDTGTLSTYLRQLIKSGYIQKTFPEKWGTPYQLCDTLFKLWLSSKPI